MCKAESSSGPKAELLLSPPPWSYRWHSLCWSQCVTIHLESFQAAKLTQTLGSRVFIGVPSHTAHWLAWCLQSLQEIVLLPIASTSSGGWNGYRAGPSTSHTIRLSSGSIPWGKQTVLLCAEFQGPRDHLPVAEGKNQASFWVRFSTLHYTGGQGFLPLLLPLGG